MFFLYKAAADGLINRPLVSFHSRFLKYNGYVALTSEIVKKLENELLLLETSRASQANSLLKVKMFFNLKVSVSEHNSLNKSRGIVKDRTLTRETEENIVEYLALQGVTACKRFKIKKDNVQQDTNTLLLTFNTTTLPKRIRIFYRTVAVEQFIPNSLRCINCQKFGHHENNCKLTDAVICDRCCESEHTSNICQKPFKCVNCVKNHIARSIECEGWKRKKEIMRIKTIREILYFEAKNNMRQVLNLDTPNRQISSRKISDENLWNTV